MIKMLVNQLSKVKGKSGNRIKMLTYQQAKSKILISRYFLQMIKMLAYEPPKVEDKNRIQNYDVRIPRFKAVSCDLRLVSRDFAISRFAAMGCDMGLVTKDD
jgi:hypothetical protein